MKWSDCPRLYEHSSATFELPTLSVMSEDNGHRVNMVYSNFPVMNKEILYELVMKQ